jgi:hypothetical protein
LQVGSEEKSIYRSPSVYEKSLFFSAPYSLVKPSASSRAGSLGVTDIFGFLCVHKKSFADWSGYTPEGQITESGTTQCDPGSSLGLKRFRPSRCEPDRLSGAVEP